MGRKIAGPWQRAGYLRRKKISCPIQSKGKGLKSEGKIVPDQQDIAAMAEDWPKRSSLS